jgi:hypothetical protein
LFPASSPRSTRSVGPFGRCESPIDSLFNLEFFGHPRSNRTVTGWREAFQRLGLAVSQAVYSKSLGLMQRITYVVDRA